METCLARPVDFVGHHPRSVPGEFQPLQEKRINIARAPMYDVNGNPIHYEKVHFEDRDGTCSEQCVSFPSYAISSRPLPLYTISFSDPDGEYYSIKELQERAVPGLDYEHREKYLRANDFKDVLGMTKQEFNSLPKWKQTKAKRAAHLF